MDDSSLARESSPATGLDSNKEQHRMASDDQQFLLYFIMGTYFGPNLKGETPHKSVLQRIAEGLPPYTVEQLAGSQIKRAEVEKVYYHALRKADQSVIAKLPILRQFFHGNILTQGQDDTANYPQFPDLFPPQFHLSSLSRNRSNMFENIVFMSNPETYHIKPEDIERFKRLTGLEGFDLDREAVRLHTKRQGRALHDQTVYKQECDGKSPLTRPFQNPLDDPFKLRDPLTQGGAAAPTSGLQYNGTPVIYSYTSLLPTQNDSDHVQKNGPVMIFLPSPPTEKEWSNIVAATKNGFVLTGSAARGQIGPTIGLIDIGESDDTYLFRVALPGVKRDEKEFSCEIENEGQVLIRGVTVTGEKTVYRCSQMFEMQTQNLCPAGKFSISFQLPGPVNPQQFAGNFGTDGILEGVVMKQIDVKW